MIMHEIVPVARSCRDYFYVTGGYVTGGEAPDTEV